MSFTKGKYVEAAFNMATITPYVFDLQPEDLETGLLFLDIMMAEWNAKGIRLSYPLPSSQSVSSLTEETNVPDMANSAIISNLAVMISAAYGKAVSQTLSKIAADSFATLMARFADAPPMQLPGTMPAGAGSRRGSWTTNPFISPPISPIAAGPDSNLLI